MTGSYITVGGGERRHSISDDQGALLEPLSVAVHAVRRSKMAAGDSVTIVGAGPIGLVTLAAARAAGAGEVFVVERATARKEKARQGGAHHVIDPGDGDPVTQIQELTPGGLGTDVSFECVGHGVTLNVALGAIRKGGTAAIVGVFEEPASVNFNDLVFSERSLVGVLGYVDDFPRAIALLADERIDADPLITSRVSLGDAIEDGFRELVRNKDEHVKILIDPSGNGTARTSVAAAEPAAIGS